MIKKFEDFLSNESVDESNESKVIVKYRWFDYYNDKWYVTECEVIKRKKRTADIKLLGWGPKGRKPGDIMQVHLKSLIGLENGLQKKKGSPDLSWRKATDPDTFKNDDDDFDDINEGIKNSVERDSEAKNLVGIAKKCFADNDLENAGKAWCEIFDLYDDMYNENTHNEEERMKIFTDFQNVMRLFTDDEVYGITNYLKKKEFN